MIEWSPNDAIAMERRHIVEGEQRVARQEMLVLRMTERGNRQLIHDAHEVLLLLREAAEASWTRLGELEDRYGNRPV
jgi:hypothetical protein